MTAGRTRQGRSDTKPAREFAPPDSDASKPMHGLRETKRLFHRRRRRTHISEYHLYGTWHGKTLCLPPQFGRGRGRIEARVVGRKPCQLTHSKYSQWALAQFL